MVLSPTEVTTCGCMAQGLDESYSLPGSNHHSHRHRLKFPQSKKKSPGYLLLLLEVYSNHQAKNISSK